MIILGKSPDDKGTQLEQLAQYLLTQLGYEHIVTNEVGGGADEIDLTAEFRQPGIKNNIFHEVICECKAYKNPLTLPDWLKFLGKLYAKEHGPARSVQGCFIALNGVNGNVHGHFKNLNIRDGKLQIVEGEDLVNLLRKHIAIQSIDVVLAQLKAMTVKTAVNTDLLYYQKKCFWLIEFSEDVFTLFSAEGLPLEGKIAQQISQLVQLNTVLKEYVDLLAESSARSRMLLIEKYVLSVLMLETKPMAIKSMLSLKSLKTVKPQTGKVTSADIQAAIATLITAGIIAEKDGQYTVRTHLNGGNVSNTVNFFKHFLMDSVLLFPLGSKQYRSLIDLDLLKEFARIQGKLKLMKENENDYINLLRWSPGALTWACHPDNFLLNHRNDGLPINKEVQQLGCSYFLQKLIDHFTADYNNDGLRDYFLNKCGIVEMEKELRLKIKSNQILLAEPHYKQRLALGQMGAEYKNVIVPILLLDDQPEPWERSKAV